MSAAPFLANVESPERELMLGMVFLWTLADDHEVTAHRDALVWVGDYAADLLARDAALVALPLDGLKRYARDNVEAFVDAAREHRPDLLAACEAATAGDA